MWKCWFSTTADDQKNNVSEPSRQMEMLVFLPQQTANMSKNQNKQKQQKKQYCRAIGPKGTTKANGPPFGAMALKYWFYWFFWFFWFFDLSAVGGKPIIY